MGASRIELHFKSGARHVIEREVEMIDVSTIGGREPVKTWSFTDKAGHAHAYGEYGSTPTLEARYDDEYWCDDCEDVHQDFLGKFCRQCGEKVEPKTLASLPRQSMPGRVSFTIDGEPATPERAEELYGEWKAEQ